ANGRDIPANMLNECAICLDAVRIVRDDIRNCAEVAPRRWDDFENRTDGRPKLRDDLGICPDDPPTPWDGLTICADGQPKVRDDLTNPGDERLDAGALAPAALDDVEIAGGDARERGVELVVVPARVHRPGHVHVAAV